MFIAPVLATLALAQAAAGTGLHIGASALLGPSFYAWRGEARRSSAVRIRGLTSEPLTSMPLRVAAQAMGENVNNAAVRRFMIMAERISRRDLAVQVWLAEDALRANDVPAALRHYDILLRTQEELRTPLLHKMAGALSLVSVRTGLVPYATAANPWFPPFLSIASTQGHAIAAATLLLHQFVLPDRVEWRRAYAMLVPALAKEGRFGQLRELYTRLPGGAGGRALSDPALEADGYAPFRWRLSIDENRFATIVPNGSAAAIQVETAPLTSGMAAYRLILPPSGAPVLGWTVVKGFTQTNGEARWVIRCRDDGRVAVSAVLTSGPGEMASPRSCVAADVALTVVGGTDSARQTLRVTDLHWLPAFSSQRPAEISRHAL